MGQGRGMPSLGHVAVGLAVAKMTPAPTRLSGGAWSAALVGLSLLPDTDVVAFALGVPYHAPLGHRGAAHSLAFAAACGLLCAAGARLAKVPGTGLGVVAALVVASHGILDTLTDGGLGIALFWPFSSTRYFAPWRPVPIAPIGIGMLSARGLEVVLAEAVLFLPFFLVAAWPKRR